MDWQETLTCGLIPELSGEYSGVQSGLKIGTQLTMKIIPEHLSFPRTRKTFDFFESCPHNNHGISR